MARLVLSVASMLGCLCIATGHPWFFAVDEGCNSMPTVAREGHKAPKKDGTITITLADSKGDLLTAVCPGASYDLNVSYPEPRENLVLVSVGTLDGGKGDYPNAEVKCPNRLVAPQEAPSPDKTRSYKAVWKVPCNATGTANVSVTSATGSTSAFLQNSLTAEVGTDCPATTCTEAVDAATNTTATAEASPSPAVGTSPSPSPAGGASPSGTNGADGYRPLGLLAAFAAGVVALVLQS